VVINRQDFGEWETFYLEAIEAPEQGTALACENALNVDPMQKSRMALISL
jgi:hypothetical protein